MGEFFRKGRNSETMLFMTRRNMSVMRIPLVILMTFLSAVFGVMSANLITSGLTEAAFGMVFFCLSSASFALIIFLWRNILSLLVTPITIAAMLLFGTPGIELLTVSLGSLLLAVTYAACVMTRETMFERIIKLTVTLIIIITLSGIAYAGAYDGGFTQLKEDIYSYIRELTASYLSSQDSVYALSYGTVTDSYTENLTSSVYASIPAIIVCLSTISSWLIDFVVKSVLRLLDAEDEFIPITHRITTPKALALIQIISAALMLMTTWDNNPALYIMVRNVFLSTSLPCVYIAGVCMWRFIMIKMYFIHGKRMIAFLIIVTPLMMLGFTYFLLLCGAAGSVAILKKRRGGSSWLLV